MFFAVANTILRQVTGGIIPPPPVPPFIWNLNTRLWNLETRVWAQDGFWESVATGWENELNTWN